MTRKNIGRLAILAIFVAGFFVLGPSSIGGPVTYVVIDGTSMQPTLVDGDLAVVRHADRYRSGDVIAFKVPAGEADGHGLVIHRIVGGSATEGFITQGDNRTGTDPWRPKPEEIVGSLWFSAPGLGASVVQLRSPMLLAPLAAGVTVFLVLIGGGTRGRPASDGGRPAPARREMRP